MTNFQGMDTYRHERNLAEPHKVHAGQREPPFGVMASGSIVALVSLSYSSTRAGPERGEIIFENFPARMKPPLFDEYPEIPPAPVNFAYIPAALISPLSCYPQQAFDERRR